MTTSDSASQRYEITTSLWEAGKSHWVCSPTLSDKLSGQTLLTLDPHWSLDSQERWLGDSIVELSLRKYPGHHDPDVVVVALNCADGTAKVGELEVKSFADVEAALDGALTWRELAPAGPPAEPPGSLSHRERVRILIAVGTVLALALIGNYAQALAVSLLTIGVDGPPSTTAIALDLASRFVVFAGATYVGVGVAPESPRLVALFSAFIALVPGSFPMLDSSEPFTTYNVLSLAVIVVGVSVGVLLRRVRSTQRA